MSTVPYQISIDDLPLLIGILQTKIDILLYAPWQKAPTAITFQALYIRRTSTLLVVLSCVGLARLRIVQQIEPTLAYYLTADTTTSTTRKPPQEYIYTYSLSPMGIGKTIDDSRQIRCTTSRIDRYSTPS